MLMMKRSKSFSAAEQSEFGAMLDHPTSALPITSTTASSRFGTLLQLPLSDDPKLFPSSSSMPMIRAHTGATRQVVAKGLHEELVDDDLPPSASALISSFPLPPTSYSIPGTNLSSSSPSSAPFSSASSPPPAVPPKDLPLVLAALSSSVSSSGPAPSLPLPPLPRGPSGFRGFGLEGAEAGGSRRGSAVWGGAGHQRHGSIGGSMRRASFTEQTSSSATSFMPERRVYASVSAASGRQVIRLKLSTQSMSQQRQSGYMSEGGDGQRVVNAWGGLVTQDSEMLADESDMDEEDHYISRFTRPPSSASSSQPNSSSTQKRMSRPILAPIQYPPAKRPLHQQHTKQSSYSSGFSINFSKPSPTASTFSYHSRSDSPDLEEVMRGTPKPRRRRVVKRRESGDMQGLVMGAGGRPVYRRASSAPGNVDGSSASETESDIDLVTDLPTLAVRAGILTPSSRLLKTHSSASGWSGSDSEEEVIHSLQQRRRSSASASVSSRRESSTSSSGFASPMSSSRFSMISNTSTLNSSVYSAPSLSGSGKDASRLSVSSNEGSSSISSARSSSSFTSPPTHRLSVMMNGRPLPLPKKDSGLDFGPFEEPKNQDEYDEYEVQQKIIRGSVVMMPLEGGEGDQTPKPASTPTVIPAKPLFLRPQTTQISSASAASAARRRLSISSQPTTPTTTTPSQHPNRRTSVTQISTVNYLRRPSADQTLKPLLSSASSASSTSTITPAPSASKLRKPTSVADLRSASLPSSAGKRTISSSFLPTAASSQSVSSAPSAFNASRLPKSLGRRPSLSGAFGVRV